MFVKPRLIAVGLISRKESFPSGVFLMIKCRVDCGHQLGTGSCIILISLGQSFVSCIILISLGQSFVGNVEERKSSVVKCNGLVHIEKMRF